MPISIDSSLIFTDILSLKAEFNPNSTKEIAHHMLLFGCADAGDEDIW